MAPCKYYNFSLYDVYNEHIIFTLTQRVNATQQKQIKYVAHFIKKLCEIIILDKNRNAEIRDCKLSLNPCVELIKT